MVPLLWIDMKRGGAHYVIQTNLKTPTRTEYQDCKHLMVQDPCRGLSRGLTPS